MTCSAKIPHRHPPPFLSRLRTPKAARQARERQMQRMFEDGMFNEGDESMGISQVDDGGFRQGASDMPSRKPLKSRDSSSGWMTLLQP